MAYKDLMEAQLWAGTEDFDGLFEAVYEVNTLYPETMNTGLNLAAAMGVLGDLFRRGWIELYRSRDALGHDPEPIVDCDRAELLLDPDNWDLPPKGGFIRFRTTELGRKALGLDGL